MSDSPDKCFNCDNDAVYEQHDPGLSIVKYCETCLPKHLKGRAEHGDFNFAPSKGRVSGVGKPRSLATGSKDSGTGKVDNDTDVADSESSTSDNGTGASSPKPRDPSKRPVSPGTVLKTSDTDKSS